jgi:hypothetical protein
MQAFSSLIVLGSGIIAIAVLKCCVNPIQIKPKTISLVSVSLVKVNFF